MTGIIIFILVFFILFFVCIAIGILFSTHSIRYIEYHLRNNMPIIIKKENKESSEENEKE